MTTPEKPTREYLMKSSIFLKPSLGIFCRNSIWSLKESFESPAFLDLKIIGISEITAPRQAKSQINEDWKLYPLVDKYEKSRSLRNELLMALYPDVQSLILTTPPTYLTNKFPTLLINNLKSEKSGVEPPAMNLEPMTTSFPALISVSYTHLTLPTKRIV